MGTVIGNSLPLDSTAGRFGAGGMNDVHPGWVPAAGQERGIS